MMRNQLRLLFLLFLLHLQFISLSQKKAAESAEAIFKTYQDGSSSAYNPQKRYYIIHTTKTAGDIPPEKKIRILADHVAIVSITSNSSFDSLAQYAQQVPANDTWKLSPQVDKMASQKSMQKFIITGYDTGALLSILKTMGKELSIVTVQPHIKTVVVKTSLATIKNKLLALKEVIFIDAVAEAQKEASIIGYNRSFHGINAVDFLLPNANGKGIVAGVKEQKMDENDIDLWKRVLPSPLAASTPSYHATVIASIIGGAGNSSYQGRGIAWGCQFFPSSFANLFADDETILHANRVTVQNHSYGTIVQQYYGAEALSYDQLAWNSKTYVPVFSAGNQGEAAATEGQYANIPGFANLTGNFKMAKNIVLVGAVNDKEIIVAQSSSGPIYDGRIAPHLIALGPSGTSDAAAVVTGTIAVMQQVYADSNRGTLPPSSLIKAVLFNTAEDIHQNGIDYKTGYGQLNSYTAVKTMLQKHYDGSFLSQGQQWTKDLDLPAGIHSLKVTLAWTDSAATINNNKAIINDLDLEVVEVAKGTVYKPWVLNSDANRDSLLKTAERKRDSLNTAEQVSISLPAPGTYLIKVKGNTIPNQPLPFHVSYKTDSLHTFVFTSPLQSADLERDESEPVSVRWKTSLADSTQTGDLSISYDNGTTWQPVASSIKLATGQHLWQAKDTTATAMLKMQTPFGQFFSSHFMLSKPTRVRLDFNCADSFRLSWNKHPYASAYKLYVLTDSPYLEPALTVTDTVVVIQKNTAPLKVYAVEPVLNNSLQASRSGAIDLNLQGVQCFYRTIYYNLLDNNRININLEISTTAYVDSIYFETVSANGQWLKTVGRYKAANGNLQYSSVVDNVPAGITYVRGRIQLEDGSSIFTEIIPVFTSGTKSIWFYPNPARKNEPIKYVIKQGVPPSSPLQLFDANGRLLRNYAELPSHIDASSLPSGLIIYKLLDSQKKLLEAGKLIVQ